MEKCCCGFGHSEYYGYIEKDIQEVIERLIVEDGINVFYAGNYGNFDSVFSSAVRSCKSRHKEIELILVMPYVTSRLKEYKYVYERFYDCVIIPPEIVGCHYKSAITKLNRWKVEQSDVVLSGVYNDFGGAYTAVKYAKKLNKRIIDVVPKK